jgi:hypothetical protein
MAIPVAIAALGKFLIANGLPLLADAAVSKGKDWVEEKTGIRLPDPEKPLDPTIALELKRAEFAHQEVLLQAATEERAQTVDWMKTEMQEVTKRWSSDMLSDSWLSKNIRPVALAFFLALLGVCVVASWFEVDTSKGLLDVLETWGGIVLVAYFGGRTIEKGMSMHQRGKALESS